MNDVNEIERFLDTRWFRGKSVSEHELLSKIDADGYEERRFILIEMMKQNIDFVQSFLKTFSSYFPFIKEHIVKENEDNMYKLIEIDSRIGSHMVVDDYIDYVETSKGALFLAQTNVCPDFRLKNMIDDSQDAIAWVRTFEQDIRYMRDIVKYADDDFWVDLWNGLMDKLDEPEFKIY